MWFRGREMLRKNSEELENDYVFRKTSLEVGAARKAGKMQGVIIKVPVVVFLVYAYGFLRPFCESLFWFVEVSIPGLLYSWLTLGPEID